MRGVVGLLVLAACGGHDVPRTPAPPTVAILEPGAEPRVQLRYAPQPGVVERIEQTIKFRTTTTITNTVLETGTKTVDAPSIQILTLYEPTQILPDGAFGVTASIYDVIVLDDALDASLLRQVKTEAAALRGVHVSWRESPQGQTTNVVVDPPRSRSRLLDGFRNAVSHPAIVVLPEQPVGVGARWRIVRRNVEAGVVWDDVFVVHLIALTDAAATIEIDQDSKAAPQSLSVEPNATRRLSSGRITSRQQFVVPRHGVAVTGDGQQTTEVHMSIVRKSLRISTTVLTETSVLSRPAPQSAPDPNAGPAP